jgi:non-ribosomal peptide synthase protein (TIGR01720 family)
MTTTASVQHEHEREHATQVLTETWTEVLGLETAPLADDNFFDLGGDSLLAVRVAARASEQGLECSARDVFERQTIHELATVVRERRAAPVREARRSEDTVPLLPAQQRWVDGDIPEIDYFNLDVLFSCPAGLRVEHLKEVAAAMLWRHEALAVRYVRSDGGWSAHPVAVDDALVEGAVEQRRLPAGEDELAVELERAHRSLSLADGRIFRLVHFENGGEPGRLFVLVHHLTADGVSMTTVADDLETAVVAAQRGEPIHLPPASPPRLLAEAVVEWSRSPEAVQHARRWHAFPWSEVAPLPVDRDGRGFLPSNRTARETLSEQTTSKLAGGRGRTGPSAHDAVLGAVLLAIAAWSGKTTHLVDVYGHNRDRPPAGLDLARTVGYVQSTYPVVVRVDPEAAPGDALEGVRRQLGSVPSPKSGFDALRYLPGDPHGLRRLPAAEIRHNFRGGLARVLERKGSLLREAEEETVLNRSPLQTERYKLMIEGDVLDGRLVVGVRYSTERYDDETVRRLVAHVAELLTSVASER